MEAIAVADGLDVSKEYFMYLNGIDRVDRKNSQRALKVTQAGVGDGDQLGTRPNI